MATDLEPIIEQDIYDTKKNRTKQMPTHFHWDVITRNFVQGSIDGDGRRMWPTLKELCQEYGCSYSQIRRHMVDEDWLARRNQYKAETKRRVLDREIDNFEKASSHFDASCLSAAQLGIDHILYWFQMTEGDDRVMDGVQLDRLSRAIVSYQRVGRLVLGLSTDNNVNRNKVEEAAKANNLDLTRLNEKELKVLEILAARIEERQATNEINPNKPIPIASKMKK